LFVPEELTTSPGVDTELAVRAAFALTVTAFKLIVGADTSICVLAVILTAPFVAVISLFTEAVEMIEPLVEVVSTFPNVVKISPLVVLIT
jgi:hypothetical protein